MFAIFAVFLRLASRVFSHSKLSRKKITPSLAHRSFVSGNGADVPSYVEPVVTPGHEFSARVVQLGVGAAEVRLVTLDALQCKENVV